MLQLPFLSLLSEPKRTSTLLQEGKALAGTGDHSPCDQHTLKTKDTSSTSPRANKGKLQREQKECALGQNGSWLHQKLRGCEEFNVFHQGWSSHGVLQLCRAVLPGTLGCAEPPARNHSTSTHALGFHEGTTNVCCLPVLLQTLRSLPAAGRYCLTTHPAFCRAPQSSGNKSQSQKQSHRHVLLQQKAVFSSLLHNPWPPSRAEHQPISFW